MFSAVTPLLDERQRRVLVGAQARALGRGGITAVSRASGASLSTVQKGMAEVAAGVDPAAPVRRPGAGRKKLIDKQPHLLLDLDDLVEPEARGDPECPLRWTSKSTGHLADALVAMGYELSPDTVGRLLVELEYSLQATAKMREGIQNPDRDAQFVYLSEQVGEHLRHKQPVISVDTKKKELVGQRSNGGKEYQPKGRPERVDVHDFPDPEVPKAIPYGVYDIGANQAWVSVGDDHDTAAFAVATIGRWWDMMGCRAYPKAKRLLITADAGGSNGYRVGLWKVELGRLAARTGLAITVCHFPPGTSKWNKVEHRLWSQVSINWRGKPLTSHEVVVQLIGATKTKTGLQVRAERDEGYYPKGVKVTKEELAAVPLDLHDFHGDWNYTVRPRHRRAAKA
ncbi:MAG: ISAzo13 family transposase [Actinobacteria bacterium]|nr:ISAzo13 family transposase [Actinomycetota bacterium]